MVNTKTITMVRGERTSLTKANNDRYSLRTTVPKVISNQFELKEGDSIVWEIKPNPDGKSLTIVVTPYPEKSSGKKNGKK